MSGMKVIVMAAVAAFGLAGAASAADSLGSFSAGKDVAKDNLSTFRSTTKTDSSFGLKSTNFKGGDLFASGTMAKPGFVSKDASKFTITGGTNLVKASEAFKTKTGE